MSTSSSSAQRGKFIVLEGLDKAGKSTQCARLVSKLQARGQSVQSLRFPDRTTAIGQLIDQYLRGGSEKGRKVEENNTTGSSQPPTPSDHAMHLLFSANRWEHAAAIESTLQSGTSIVCDRYYYSGCVYSAAKKIPGLDLAWARAPDVGLPRPDLCLLLDVSAEVAMERAAGGVVSKKRGEEASSDTVAAKTVADASSLQPMPNNDSDEGKEEQRKHERYETPSMQARVRQLFDDLRAGGTGGNKHVDETDDIVVIDAGASLDKVEEAVLQQVLRTFEEVDASRKPLRHVLEW